MAKKSYLVGIKVQVVVMPVIYMEVIADNAEDARRQVKAFSQKKNFLETHRGAILDEFKESVENDEILIDNVDSICTPDRANEFHSEAECDICAKVTAMNQGHHGPDLAEAIRKLRDCTTLRAIQIANTKY